MNLTVAALPLLLMSGLAGASDIHRLPATPASPANAAGTAALSDADRARLRAELDSARQQLNETSKRIAELSMTLNELTPRTFALQYINESRRALIGVVLGAEADGIKVIGLTPNGPAAKAGIKVGDRLVTINNKAVDNVTGDSESAVASARALFGELEDGQSVPVQVERAGQTMSFTPKAERRAPAEWTQLLGEPLELELKSLGQLKSLEDLKSLEALDLHGKELQILSGPDGERNVELIIKREGDGPGMQQRRVEMMRLDQGSSLNLSTLNPELGKYFGTDRGILVLEANEKTLPQLRAGDVIQVIDGQPADSVTDVVRAMARKSKGELMTFEVFRDRQRQVLNIPAPERHPFFHGDHPFGTPKAPPKPPVPPAAPSPPPKAPMPVPPPRGTSV